MKRRKRRAVSTKKVHSWRICPAGQHYRRGTTVRPHTREGKLVRGGPRAATCARNPSGLDQLYPEEIEKIATDYFDEYKRRPLTTLSEYRRNGNAYDHLIQGWVTYWNDVLRPSDPLDPDLIKALIASESGFNPKAWNRVRGPGRARGLLQVTDQTLRWLTDDYDELEDHFLNLSEDDMLDPSFAICAGVRWLYRKKQIIESRRKKQCSWRDAVAAFKGVSPTDRLMKKFDAYYAEMKGNKK